MFILAWGELASGTVLFDPRMWCVSLFVQLYFCPSQESFEVFLLSVCAFLCTHLAKPQQDAAELNVVGEKPMIILTGLTLHLLPQTSSSTFVLMGSHSPAFQPPAPLDSYSHSVFLSSPILTQLTKKTTHNNKE